MADGTAGGPGADGGRRASWVDVLIDLVDRLPVPAWVTWLALGTLLLAVEVGLAILGKAPVEPFAVYFAVAGVYAIGLVHYLERASGGAFDAFRGSIRPAERPRADGLRDELTSLPAVPAAVVAVGAIAVSLIVLLAGGPLEEQVRASGLVTTPAGIPFQVALYVFNYAVTGALLYRIWHQSRVVDGLYRIAEVDLLRPAPLHAFAWLGAQSVVGLAVMFYAPILLLPGVGGALLWAIRIALGVVLAALFLWPLLGVHRLLMAERDRLLARSLARWRAFFDEFHARLEKGERGMNEVTKNELDVLEREQRTLRAMSTWPWAAEVIPTVLGAIILPLVLSLLVGLAQGALPD